MVFDTLKNTLTNFTDGVADTVLHPIDSVTNMTKAMKKTVIGPDTNLIKLVEDKLRYTPFMQKFEKEIKLLMRKVSSAKIAKTKKEKIKNALQKLLDEGKTERTFSGVKQKVKVLFSGFEKLLKKSKIPTIYIKDSWSSDTVELTEKDTSFFLPLFQDTQIEINGTIEDLEKTFYEQYSTPLNSSYDHKSERETFYSVWKKKIDTLIENEYEVTKTQKELLYTAENLKKQLKIFEELMIEKREGKADKDSTRNIHKQETKIKDILEKVMPITLKTLDKNIAKVSTDEKNISGIWKDYRSVYKKEQTKEKQRTATNRVATQKIININTKKRSTLKNQLTSHEKKIGILHTKIEKLIENIHTTTEAKQAKNFFLEEKVLDDTYIEKTLVYLSSYTQQIHYHLKDLQAESIVVNNHTTFLYDTLSLEKGRILQLKILLNLKRKHYDLSNKVWHTLLEAETSSNQKLSGIINHCKRHFEIFKKQRKTYEQEIGTQRKFIDTQRKEVKESQQSLEAINMIQQRLLSKNTYELNTFYATSLNTLQSLHKDYLKVLKKNIKESDKKLKGMNAQQEENKNSENHDNKKKSTIKKLELDIHQYERYRETLAQYLAHAEEEYKDNVTLIKYYKKDARWNQKKMDFYESQAKKHLQKVSKNKSFKPTIKEPKKINGTTL